MNENVPLNHEVDGDVIQILFITAEIYIHRRYATRTDPARSRGERAPA